MRTARWLASWRMLSVVATVLLVLAAPPPVAAHGGATGVDDALQDYGVMAFLLATVLIGAGVLAWVMLSPTPREDDEGREEPAAPA